MAQGKENAKEYLKLNTAVSDKIEAEIRAKMNSGEAATSVSVVESEVSDEDEIENV